MQKKLAILFAFFIVFAPVYSNAVLPALAATVASNSGRVLVGQTIKKVAPSALANARKAAVGICVKYPKLCGGGMGALGLALTADNWSIDVTNNDVTNDIDVDIYKYALQGQCQLEIGFGTSKLKQSAHITERLAALTAQNSTSTKHNVLSHADSSSVYADTTAAVLKSNASYNLSTWKLIQNISLPYILMRYTESGYVVSQPKFMSGDSVYVRCVAPPTSKIYLSNNELNQYITDNNINDIDILDIYNFDFSQYNNINIGGDTYNGTTINNDLAKSDPNEVDKKVSVDLKKKLDAKELSLDDVTDENCTKNEAGEYDKCGDDKDAEPEPEPENPEEPEPGKNPTCELEENLFRKKICEWIDWTQKEPKKSTSEPVDVKEVEAENSNKIDMSGECPAPYELSFNVLGYEQNHSISYEPLCGALIMLKPIFVGSGALSGMFILMGYSRASNTGVN